MHRREFVAGIAGSGALGIAGCSTSDETRRAERPSQNLDDPPEDEAVRNVIFMIGDGMGFDAVEIASLIHGDLRMQSMSPSGFTRTACRSGEVTDSAAAGTALATGVKAYNRQISVYGKDGASGTPLTTGLEAATAAGKRTGIVTTTRTTHATPGSFAAHVPDRGMEETVAEQLLDAEVDVVLGGGRREWSDDKRNRARELGYEVLDDRSALDAATGDRLLGTFAESHLPFVLDRDEDVPPLPEMTDVALDRLSGNEDGFFLLVEGGRIDHAGHRNDIGSSVAEVEEFDRTVEQVLDWANERDDTLVVVTSDHETGGLVTGTDYGDPIDRERIAAASASNEAMDERIRDGESIRDVLADGVGVEPNESEREQIDAAIDGDYRALRHAIGDVVAEHVGVAWGSVEHTGPAQMVLAEGPGVEPVSGWFHHTDLSATVVGRVLFDGVGGTPEAGWDDWERRIVEDGPDGAEDARHALRYVGPATNEVADALDVDDNGVVDYGDVLAIRDGDVERPSIGSGPITRSRLHPR